MLYVPVTATAMMVQLIMSYLTNGGTQNPLDCVMIVHITVLMNCMQVASVTSAVTLLVERREGHLACKNTAASVCTGFVDDL